ncbi:MAG: DUF3368 domain-containing protein [Lewinellaceae bacterium]|nr:DUF3368 domain-containing protein [Phaeodactylibacter sp.]MCB9039625.1 DUF3368 domain-containing protein [Lewinellaceae bacterium]
MIVVSDASPIINLSIIGKLGLLKDLYEKVVIPQAVFDELTVKGASQPGDQEVRNADWIEVISCEDTELVKRLHSEIDLGEAEAITLVLQLEAGLLLIDEKIGRSRAKAFHIKTIGLLGMLIECKHRGWVTSVTALMDRLRSEANFRIGEGLYEEVRQIVGE